MLLLPVLRHYGFCLGKITFAMETEEEKRGRETQNFARGCLTPSFQNACSDDSISLLDESGLLKLPLVSRLKGAKENGGLLNWYKRD